MNSLALAKPAPVAYAVEFLPPASRALMRIPPAIVAEIRGRLEEIAEVAAVAGDLGFVVLDGVGSSLRLEIGGYTLSYVISDACHLLTVLSVVPALAR